MAKVYVFTPPNAGSSILTSTIYPNADGASVEIPWSADILAPSAGGWETSNGTNTASAGYSWTNFDAVIQNQLNYGAHSVVVSLSPISFSNGVGRGNKTSPQYIFSTNWAASLSVPQLYTGATSDYPGDALIPYGTCAQGVDNTAFPAAWTTPFLTAWKAAVGQALTHMAGQSYAPYIAYIRVGGGAGGEWFPWATQALETLCSPANVAGLKTQWMAYNNTMQSYITGLGTGFQFVQAMDGGFASQNIPYHWCTSEATNAVTNSMNGIGTEGLKGQDITNFNAVGYADGNTHVSGYPSMNSAYLFKTYLRSSQLTHLQTQTSAASDPTNTNQPGSLVPLLPYATNTIFSTDIELYYVDWQVAYDPANTNHGTYGAAYAQAIQTARGIVASWQSDVYADTFKVPEAPRGFYQPTEFDGFVRSLVKARSLQITREMVLVLPAVAPYLRVFDADDGSGQRSQISTAHMWAIDADQVIGPPAVIHARNLQITREVIIPAPVSTVHARDLQITREAIIIHTPTAKDFQIIREAILQANPLVRNLQVFRETVLIRPLPVNLLTFFDGDTDRVLGWGIPTAAIQQEDFFTQVFGPIFLQPQLCINT